MLLSLLGKNGLLISLESVKNLGVVEVKETSPLVYAFNLSSQAVDLTCLSRRCLM
jgi:hypothetical protein